MALQLRCGIDKKRAENNQKSSQRLVRFFKHFFISSGPNLARFWKSFGLQIGTKLAPNGTKTDTKTNEKYHRFLEPLRNDFWWIWGSNLGVQGVVPVVSFSWFLGSWGLLGAKMALRRPKRPYKAPKMASKSDFGAIWLMFD